MLSLLHPILFLDLSLEIRETFPKEVVEKSQRRTDSPKSQFGWLPTNQKERVLKQVPLGGMRPREQREREGEGKRWGGPGVGATVRRLRGVEEQGP